MREIRSPLPLLSVITYSPKGISNDSMWTSSVLKRDVGFSGYFNKEGHDGGRGGYGSKVPKIFVVSCFRTPCPHPIGSPLICSDCLDILLVVKDLVSLSDWSLLLGSMIVLWTVESFTTSPGSGGPSWVGCYGIKVRKKDRGIHYFSSKTRV